ncbi:hypothetical protein ACJX0J_021882, partial [Zea mays]
DPSKLIMYVLLPNTKADAALKCRGLFVNHPSSLYFFFFFCRLWQPFYFILA